MQQKIQLLNLKWKQSKGKGCVSYEQFIQNQI